MMRTVASLSGGSGIIRKSPRDTYSYSNGTSWERSVDGRTKQNKMRMRPADLRVETIFPPQEYSPEHVDFNKIENRPCIVKSIHRLIFDETIRCRYSRNRGSGCPWGRLKAIEGCTCIYQRINVMLSWETSRLMEKVSKKGSRSRLIDQALKHFIDSIGRRDLRKRIKEGASVRA